MTTKLFKLIDLLKAYLLAYYSIALKLIGFRAIRGRVINRMLKNTPMVHGKKSSLFRYIVSDFVRKKVSFTAVNSDSVKDIVLVYDLIKSGQNYSHDDAILSHASILADNSEVNSVKILATTESALFRSPTFSSNKGPETYAAVKEKLEKKYPTKRNNLSLEYFSSDSIEKLIELCSRVASQSPDVLVFNSGWDNESRLVRSIFYGRIPIARMMTQSDMIPDREADLLLAKIKDKKFLKLCNSNDLNVIFCVYPRRDLHVKNVNYEESNTSGCNREVKLITALTGKRIKDVIKGYSQKELESLLSLFDLKRRVSWLLIGDIKKEDLEGISPKLDKLIRSGQFKFSSPVSDLRPLLKDADLYVNLPGITGGGATGMLARSVETPVITDGYSDVANKQPSSFVTDSDDIKSFVVKAKQLAIDDSSRKLYFSEYNQLIKDMPMHERYFLDSIGQAKTEFLKNKLL
jgi:hypothetical protein